MIQAEDIFALLNCKPFQPFRIHLKGGNYYDIVRTFNNVPARSYLAIGVPRLHDSDPNPIAERSIDVPYADMDRVEVLAETSQTA